MCPIRGPLLYLVLALAGSLPPVAASTAGDDPVRDFPSASPESLGYRSERLAHVVEAVRSWVEEGRIVGAELLIIADGRTILHEAVGWRDRDREWPMAKDTIFRLQSMTKPVLATGALRLVEDGVLELDDPVFEHLEEFDTAALGDVTLRRLLAHTAGMDREGYNKDIWQDRFASRRDAIDSLIEHGPSYPPGEKFVYANGNSDVLAEIVERATRMPAEEFLMQRVLEPLGMRDSRFLAAPLEERGTRYASAYLIRDEGLLRYWDAATSDPSPYFRGAGGLYGTAMDFARFLTMWMDEGRFGATRFLSTETVRAAVTSSPLSRAAGGGYGMNWLLFAEPPHEDLIFGHDGSDGTIAVVVPDRRLVLAYFTQTRGTPTLIEALELMFEALADEPDPTAEEAAQGR